VSIRLDDDFSSQCSTK
jgi:hypothetical protein